MTTDEPSDPERSGPPPVPVAPPVCRRCGFSSPGTLTTLQAHKLALAAAYHSLATLHGLTVSDAETMGDRWEIDESHTLALIDAALRGGPLP